MKLMFRPIIHFLCCATQILGIKIQSVPGVNSNAVIETQLNETVSLVCRPDSSHSSRAGEELVWLRDGAAIILKEGNKEGRSSVCVTPIYEDNGATFTCHMRKNAADSASVTLNVRYGPQLSGSEEVQVEEEVMFLLECDIMANPPVSSVSWTLNGSLVDLVAGGFTVTNNGFKSQLYANKAERSLHEGTYQCSANSSSYGVHSKLFQVTLTEKTLKFPLMPMIAGLVVVGLTVLLAIISRWKKIIKCFK